MTPQERKQCPVGTLLIEYFPDAIREVARVAQVGNDQHNPGQRLHWAKHKSYDHVDCAARHLLDMGPNWDAPDTDGMLHATKFAMRALMALQMVLDAKKLGITAHELQARINKEADGKPEYDPKDVAFDGPPLNVWIPNTEKKFPGIPDGLELAVKLSDGYESWSRYYDFWGHKYWYGTVGYPKVTHYMYRQKESE